MDEAGLLGPLQLVGINVELPPTHLGHGVGLFEQRLALLQIAVQSSSLGHPIEQLCPLFHPHGSGLGQALKDFPLGGC